MYILSCTLYIGAKIAPGDSVLEQEVIAAVARVHAKTPAQVQQQQSLSYTICIRWLIHIHAAHVIHSTCREDAHLYYTAHLIPLHLAQYIPIHSHILYTYLYYTSYIYTILIPYTPNFIHIRIRIQVILRWGVQRGCAIIAKSTHIDRIRENRGIFDFELTQEEVKDICGR